MSEKKNKVKPIDSFASYQSSIPYSLPNDNSKTALPFTVYDGQLNNSVNSAILNNNNKVQRENGVSAKATLINFLKGMIGPGCLSLPLAFRQGGLWLTLFLVIFFGFLNNYCMLQLVHCSQRLSRKKGDESMSYGTLAYEACANSFMCLRKYKQYAKLIVNLSIIALQIGICSVFYVFVAVHVKEIFKLLMGWDFTKEQWMLFILVPMILVNLLRTLKTIAIISTVGNVLMVASLVFIFQYMLRQDHHWNLPWVTNFDGVMTACGSILYSFEGQAMVLPMENRLKQPHHMVGPFGVLSVGMATVTTIYSVVGLTGYVTYGEKVMGSITQSLPNEVIFIVVRVMLTMVIYFGYVIQQYVVTEMVWPSIRRMLGFEENIRSGSVMSSTDSCATTVDTSTTTVDESSKYGKRHGMYEFCAESLFKVLLIFLTMSIALCVSNLDDIIPLVGVTAGMLLAFIFPATIDTILFVPAMLSETRDGRVNARILARIVQNIVLCVIGLFGLVFGLKSNIDNILAEKQ